MDDLNLCLELTDILLRPGKHVEDDTCLDRILSGVRKLLQSTKYISLATLVSDLSSLVEGLDSRHSVSAHSFLIRLLSLLLSATWKGSYSRIAADLILSYAEKHIQDRSCADTYSLSASWLRAIKNLTAKQEFITHLKASDCSYQNVIKMSFSKSWFVQGQAIECLAMILIKLHESECELIHFCEELTVGQGCLSMRYLIGLATAVLTLSYNTGIQILLSLDFSIMLNDHKQEFTVLSNHSDPLLCHFFESLYCDQYHNHVEDIANKIMTSSEVLKCAMICIACQPTNAVGWKILMSFIAYGQPCNERDIAITSVRNALEQHKYPDEDTLPKYILDFHRALNSRKHNVSAMGRIYCHILNAATGYSSNHTSETGLVSILSYLVPVLTATINGDDKSSKPYICVFLHCNNAMIALLSYLLKNCYKFVGSEKDLFKLVLALLKKPSTHHTTIHRCHNLANALLQHNPCEDFVRECICVTIDCLSDRRWEVRDSALEFLSELLSVHTERFNTEQPLPGLDDVLNECRKLIDDANGFVRATALSLLGDVVCVLQSKDDMDKLLTVILRVMQHDVDAIPRRKAVTTLLKYLTVKSRFLTSLHQLETSNMALNAEIPYLTETRNTIHHGLFQDLDWEVKFNSLDILSLLIQHDRSCSKVTSGSVSQNLLSMLRNMQEDYDDAVREKAEVIGESFCIENPEKSLYCLQKPSELHSLLVELLTSMRQDTEDETPANDKLNYEDDSVILDCY